MPKSFDPPQDSLNKNRVHRYSRCWRIARTDGVNFDFTDHPNSLKVRTGETQAGETPIEGVVPTYLTFAPSDGVDASAIEFSDGLSSDNFEVQGIVSSAKITEDDLRGGRFDGATIYEYLVDWRYPWNGYFERNVYIILNLSFNSFGWRADLVSKAKMLEKKAGLHWTRNCRHLFGNTGCGKNLATNDESGTAITTGTLAISSVTTQRKKFVVSSLPSGYADNEFNYGSCEFMNSSSKLSGLKVEILDFDASSKTFTLTLPTPFDLNSGLTDTVRLVQGCPKTRSACKNRFNNFVRFGGFPYIPGDDKARITPDAPS